MSTPDPNHRESSEISPVGGGNLRASDADREQVATLLGSAYAEGRLTHEEYEDRLGQAMGARTFNDLVPLTTDLVPIRSVAPVAQPGTDQSYAIDRSHPSEERDMMIAIFGGAVRKGKWRVRKTSTSIAVFGGVELDLRDAVFEAPVVEISGIWCFGGMEITVPDGIEVRDQTAGVFGGTDIGPSIEGAPGAPVLVLKGLCMFGGVSVKRPKKPKKK